jgi:hypothetical protein
LWSAWRSSAAVRLETWPAWRSSAVGNQIVVWKIGMEAGDGLESSVVVFMGGMEAGGDLESSAVVCEQPGAS